MQEVVLVLDSYGRVPQALTQGNNIDLGMADQCLYGDVKGRYCMAGLVLPIGYLFNFFMPSQELVRRPEVAYWNHLEMCF